MRVIIRGWKNGVPDFEDHYDNVPEKDDVRGQWVLDVAGNHARRLMDSPHMIEIEFADEPDPLQRYVRVGTDPSMMVNPKVYTLPLKVTLEEI